MAFNLKYSQYNNASILVEWPQKIDELILDDIIIFKSKIENYYSKQKVEVINAYTSILIIYSFTIDKFNDELSVLKNLYSKKNSQSEVNKQLWEIPVCYDPYFGEDLVQFSRTKELSISEIIELHTNKIYTVYFIGFLPGFLYLGGLDPKLKLARKRTPSLTVKKGAVGIGGNQTGIYPQDSPGGWHIIGNSPVEIFNPNESLPCIISPGDKVRFVPVSKSEHSEILKLIEVDQYNLKSKPIYA
ncbi:5-oxoprolinase subunit PxpB [Winogradskyella alexanderae]|uniref:5-oxoprolinase subunit PxpB n=1 Tax=Winogradskyella alexanderae TaxID=2877123 RepID=A0ABS7XWH4_9FLAO|nr:5-oxoprolinase subunit PxpB [Winogradskyella alexanderae]MCA0133181.1 5-oxoprolinase subunit PxpB [Winogradskyella alexanderae]